MNEANPNGHWRLSKEIPISVVGFIVVQTFALVWFLAGQNAKLTTLGEESALNKQANYSKEDARHEREFMELKFLLLQTKDDETIRRIVLLEVQVAELKARAR